MKLITIILVLTTFALLSTNVFAASHCKKDEAIFFSCYIKGTSKVASLCGNIQEPTEWLQFRFGLINKPNAIYPKSKTNSLSKFVGIRNYHNDASYGGISSSLAEVIFHLDGVNYDIERTTHGESEHYGISTQPGKGALSEIGDSNWTHLNCVKGKGYLDSLSQFLQRTNPL